MYETTLWINLRDRAKYLSDSGEPLISDLDMAKKPEMIFALVEALEDLQDQIKELRLCTMRKKNT